jgi:hypothetical protein
MAAVRVKPDGQNGGRRNAFMKLLISSRQRCVVCGYSEMRMDEVVDRGLVYLAECPRCESRWTSRQPSAVARVAAPASSMRSVTRPVPEIAPAA